MIKRALTNMSSVEEQLVGSKCVWQKCKLVSPLGATGAKRAPEVRHSADSVDSVVVSAKETHSQPHTILFYPQLLIIFSVILHAHSQEAKVPLRLAILGCSTLLKTAEYSSESCFYLETEHFVPSPSLRRVKSKSSSINFPVNRTIMHSCEGQM